MRSIRIHVDAPLQTGGDVALAPQAAAHVTRVLRLRAGDVVALFNGDGHEYFARLVQADPRRTVARIESRQVAQRESPLRITLAQALARGEKMDWIVQKATELGVAAIVPLSTGRSEVRLDVSRAAKRQERWRAIATSACEQSGRCVIPSVAAPQSLTDWLASLDLDADDMRLVLHPAGGARPRSLQIQQDNVTLVVGPEGGFGEVDLAALRQAAFHNLSLGPRILRTETAGLAAIAALQALYGDM